ncbi:MAG TPA: hypothetical protein VGM87_09275 [Roseomonas sp.]|jgi:hypothetical protein
MVGRALVLGLGVMLSGAALAQGSPTPVWERRNGDWTVSLTGGDRRCLIAGSTEAPVHQVRVLVRPGTAAPAVRPGARGQAPARAPEPPGLELIENIGGANVSLPVGQPIGLLAAGQSYGLAVTSAFPGGVRAVFTTPFNLDWTRAREVFIDTGTASALRLSANGLQLAGAAMAECLAGRAPSR